MKNTFNHNSVMDAFQSRGLSYAAGRTDVSAGAAAGLFPRPRRLYRDVRHVDTGISILSYMI